ncbi:hypothetical protein BDR07DRAFT_1407414 [Suillus spraguei]|nr:hypothetical protein BDR07DRAFT_1407414 [Suillus spraguei]
MLKMSRSATKKSLRILWPKTPLIPKISRGVARISRTRLQMTLLMPKMSRNAPRRHIHTWLLRNLVMSRNAPRRHTRTWLPNNPVMSKIIAYGLNLNAIFTLQVLLKICLEHPLGVSLFLNHHRRDSLGPEARSYLYLVTCLCYGAN